jgi:hypothetical protein
VSYTAGTASKKFEFIYKKKEFSKSSFVSFILLFLRHFLLRSISFGFGTFGCNIYFFTSVLFILNFPVRNFKRGNKWKNE